MSVNCLKSACRSTMSSLLIQTKEIEMETEKLKDNATKFKLTTTKHKSSQNPTITDPHGIIHKLNAIRNDHRHSTLTLKVIITTDFNSFDNDIFITQLILNLKGFNKNQIKIKSIHKESSVINILNIIIRIYLNLKYDHSYRTNINAITNLLSSKSAFSSTTQQTTLISEILAMECIELIQVNKDIHDTTQILYKTILNRINDDILQEYEYEIISHLTQHNINSETFPLINKETFLKDLLTEINDDKVHDNLEEFYEEIMNYVTQKKKSEFCNKQWRGYFEQQIVMEFGKECHAANNEPSTNIITYLIDHQVLHISLCILQYSS